MKRVILESPYAARNGRTIDDNIAYARWCARDCVNRGESIHASHLLYTQFLDDSKPEERELGIKAGLAWLPVADYSVYYTDHDWSSGMLAALHEHSIKRGFDFRIRALFGPAKLPATLHEEIEHVLRSKIEQ